MPTRDDQDRRSSEPFDMMSALDMLGRRIGGALVLAGALIGVGIYWSGDTTEAPEYQGFAADGEVFRLNLDSGSIIACNAERCTQILRPGQELEDNEGNTLFRVPPGPAAPAPQLSAPTPRQPAQSAPAQPAEGAPKQVDTGQ